MNYRTLLLRSLRFYRGAHFLVILGTMISTSILIGALIIGDSVTFSLRRIVFDRLGKTEFALVSGDRFLRSRIAADLAKILATQVAPLLQTGASAITNGGQRRVNNIQLIGVDARFGEMADCRDFYDNLSADEAIVNHKLASRLRLKKGDECLLRINKIGFIPKEVPLSLDSDTSVAKRFKIRDIASDERFGRFNLKADQVAPDNVFVSLSALSREMGLNGRANVLLVAQTQRKIGEALKKTWTMSDAGLDIKKLPGSNKIEIKSHRIFLEPAVAEAAFKINRETQPVLTYFANEIRVGAKTTPYSFISAPGTGIVPPDMKDDEIFINEWLAEDLSAGTGDHLRLSYYVLQPGRDLIEKTANFRITKIVPLKGVFEDRDLLPDFPGLAGESNCREWHPGLPIDLDKIRKKDEDYWNRYRGTPKAFVTLKTAQNMWGNRFGNLTAIRFSGLNKREIEDKLIKELDPARFGFVFREVKKEGLSAGSQSVNFAQLFLGLSFFIIIAALLLTGLLYVFNVEQRARQNGLLFALGFRRKDVRRYTLLEGAVLIGIGTILGSAAAILYNQVILTALKTVWLGVVGTSALHLHLKFSTILTGTVISMIFAITVIFSVTGKQLKNPVSHLQKGLTGLVIYGEKKPRFSLMLGITGVIAVIALLFVTKFETGRDSFMFFFTAGFLLLISGLAFIKVSLYVIRKKATAVTLNIFTIGMRNLLRKPVRSLTLTGLLACGLFIVFTIGANRDNAARDAGKRESGTGGFALYGESTIPIIYDLNSPKGNRFYGLESLHTDGLRYVQLRVKEGDDASCLNLNRVTNPRLLGVNPGEFSRRGSFTFIEKIDDVDPENPWSILNRELPDGTIPGVADQTVILWGLGKSVGDTLTYPDESGQSFKIKLAGGLSNSIFQGNIIISEDVFNRKYPSISGRRLFLVDTPPAASGRNIDEISQNLSRALRNQGLDIIPAATRLAEFSRVENTYLSIFLILGSFGLLLGSIGLGIIVWRSVKERQGELALLQAVGFTRRSIQKMILSEHMVLFAAGMFCGITAAFLATLPTILAPGSGIPYPTLLFLLLIVLFNGFLWLYFTAHRATAGNLLSALRSE